MKIKKLLCAALAAVAAMPTVSAFAATEDPVEFSIPDLNKACILRAQT